MSEKQNAYICTVFPSCFLFNHFFHKADSFETHGSIVTLTGIVLNLLQVCSHHPFGVAYLQFILWIHKEESYRYRWLQSACVWNNIFISLHLLFHFKNLFLLIPWCVSVVILVITVIFWSSVHILGGWVGG